MTVRAILSLLMPALLLLGGCLQSKEPLIADSRFGDAFLGVYGYAKLNYGADGRAREGETTLVRLTRRDGKIAQDSWNGTERRWESGLNGVRFAPFRGSADEAIVEADGVSHAYLYYRRAGTGAWLWDIDCSRIPQAAREELELTLDGQDCVVRRLSQVEGAIRAYLATDPRPDYKVTPRGRSASDRMVLGIDEDEDEGNDGLFGDPPRAENMMERLRRVATITANVASDEEAAEESFLARAFEPLVRAKTALFSGDWPGLWNAVWKSWLIFALIAVAIGLGFARRR